ncbi:MAG TPA: scyllo-inosose 3-dehydrogenase [Anaerolineae bacterium]
MKALVLDGEFDPRPDYPVSERERQTGIARRGSNVWRHTRLEVKEIPDPEVGPEDVLIHIGACGVCGSDLHLYETDEDGYLIYPSWTRLPVVIGHEFAGKVAAVGERVTDFRTGDLVTAEQLHYCGKCPACRRGLYDHCRNMGRLGFVYNGAFAEYVAVKDRYVWNINGFKDAFGGEDAAFEAGAVIEPTGIAYNGLFTQGGGFLPGSTVAVYGAGPIGLATIAMARLGGASRIIAFEISAPRRKLASDMGADEVCDPQALEQQGTSIHEIVLEQTGGLGADIHVECTGLPKVILPEIEQALNVGAKVINLGRRAGATPSLLSVYQDTGSKQIGGFGHLGYGTFGYIIKLMANRRVDMRRMITDRYPLEQATTAITSLHNRQGGKVMVKI